MIILLRNNDGHSCVFLLFSSVDKTVTVYDAVSTTHLCFFVFFKFFIDITFFAEQCCFALHTEPPRKVNTSPFSLLFYIIGNRKTCGAAQSIVYLNQTHLAMQRYVGFNVLKNRMQQGYLKNTEMQ